MNVPKATVRLGAIALFLLSSVLCRALPNNRGTYELAVDEAQKDKKEIGIYFDRPGSDACFQLKWRLIGKDRFEALTNKDFVFLMIQDRGTGKHGETLSTGADLDLEKQLNVTSFPTFILLSYNGTVIKRIEGYNWREDPKADKYFDQIVAAIRQGTEQDVTTSGTNALPVVETKPGTAPARIYDGDVLFAFGDGSKLVSHRTIGVTGDKTRMSLDSTDFFEEDKFVKYVSKLIMKGAFTGNTFQSSDQQSIRSDYEEWVPENISIEFSADGESATMLSIYQNSTGRVVGKGVLKLQHAKTR